MTTYIWHSIRALDEEGNHIEEKFFLGRLPHEGEAVEMVYVGRDTVTGNMHFQLRVKEP